MNDRMKIAARMMAARYWTNDPIDRHARAREALADADALIAASAEIEAEVMQWDTRDQTVVYGVRCNGDLYNAYQPDQSAPETALDKLAATAQAAGEYDEVGDWRKYVRFLGGRGLAHVAAGGMAYVDDAFIWNATPQGYDFWDAVQNDLATDADKARAQDFARRVLQAMEAEGE